MARTPSMTTAECEALLGPRGVLRVDANNRGTVKKWLTAQGFPALFVGGLSMTELALAYNQTDGKGLDAIRRKLESVPAEDREEPTSAPVTESAPQAASDIEAAIRAIAASVAPKAPTIDADAVRAIVRDEFPKCVPVTRIEIAQGEETRTLGEMPMHAQFPTLVKALAAGLHVFLCGPAGSGKTTAAELAAKALGREFRIEGAVSGEHKLTGFVDGHGKYHGTPYRDAFEAGHIFVKDEIDGDDPAGLLALNAGMANGYAAFPDVTKPVMRGEGFQVVACANTWSMGADRLYVGRNQLDAATLDRFVFIAWDYDAKLEAALCPNADWLKRVQALRAAAFAEKARIVISPRASIFGTKLLAAGLDTATVETMTIWKGVDAELRRRIEGRAH